MKKLKIYQDNDVYCIERVNEFNHATKRSFITEEGLKEGIDAYVNFGNLDEYELEVSQDLWALVINHLSKGKSNQ